MGTASTPAIMSANGSNYSCELMIIANWFTRFFVTGYVKELAAKYGVQYKIKAYQLIWRTYIAISLSGRTQQVRKVFAKIKRAWS